MNLLLQASLFLIASEQVVDAQPAPPLRDPMADARVYVKCTTTKRGKPQILKSWEQFSAGIIYDHRPITLDTYEIHWRHIEVPRWSGRAELDPGTRCEPRYVDSGGLVAECFLRLEYPRMRISVMKLMRFSPDGTALWIAPGLAYLGSGSFVPLAPGRLLIWAEHASIVTDSYAKRIPFDPDQWAGGKPYWWEKYREELLSSVLVVAEVDTSSGAILRYDGLQSRFSPQWPAGSGYILRKWPDVAETKGTPWRARWDRGAGRIELQSEAPRNRLVVCKEGTAAGTLRAAAEILTENDRLPAVAELADLSDGICVRGVQSHYHEYQPCYAHVGAEKGRLRGKVWIVDNVWHSSQYLSGGRGGLPKLTAEEVVCDLVPEDTWR